MACLDSHDFERRGAWQSLRPSGARSALRTGWPLRTDRPLRPCRRACRPSSALDPLRPRWTQFARFTGRTSQPGSPLQTLGSLWARGTLRAHGPLWPLDTGRTGWPRRPLAAHCYRYE